MASLRLKKSSSSSGAPSGSCSSHGGVFGFSSPEPAPRDGRKTREDKLTWIKHTVTPDFDGHLWRKYGQKVIKEAPYPRLYYRCSYREDRHCLASKQVQQVTHDDPPLFEVTYKHEHTCNAAPVPAPDVVAEAERQAPTTCGGVVLRFGSSAAAAGHHHRDDARIMQPQERQQYHQQRPGLLDPSSFSMMSFDYGASSSGGVPPAAASWSPSFPIIESSPAPPSTTSDEDDMYFSTLDWDSLAHGIDDDLHSGHHVQFPGHTFSWETDHGSSLAHLGSCSNF